MGRLIPAGTGMDYYQKIKIAGEDVVEEEPIPDSEAVASDSVPATYQEETQLHFTGTPVKDLGSDEPKAE